MLRAGCAERNIVLKTLKRFRKFYCFGSTRETLSSVTLRTESRDECSGVVIGLWCFYRETGTFAFYYVFGGALVPAFRDCIAYLSTNFYTSHISRCNPNLASISSDQVFFASKKIPMEIDNLSSPKG